MAILHASYLLESVRKQLKEKGQEDNLQEWEKAAFNFELITNSNLSAKPNELDTTFTLLSNSISRGHLTRPSQFLEDQFSQLFSAEFLAKGQLAPVILSQLCGDDEFSRQDSAETLQLIVVPTAVARLQKTLLEYILAGKLTLQQKKWKIAVIEQDLPCAHLAFEDFKLSMADLFLLEGKKRRLPTIELTVVSKEESELHLGKTVFSSSHRVLKTKFDLLIDIASLNSYKAVEYDHLKTTYQAKIRKSDQVTQAFYYQASSIAYKLSPKEATFAALNRISRNLFRKKLSRAQYTLLAEAMENNTVVARLPKALQSQTYGLLAFLKAGATIVVEPSEMACAGEADFFTENHIDCQLLHEKLPKKGTLSHLICLVNYKQFYQKSFRTWLKSNTKKGLIFGQVILNEAQHTSLWAHQFLPSYLPLAKLLSTFCLSNNKTTTTEQSRSLAAERSRSPILALSTSASYAALRDIRAQLGNDTTPLVLVPYPTVPQNVQVIKANLDHPDQIVKDNPKDPELALKTSIAVVKQDKLVQLIRQLEQQDKKHLLVLCTLTTGHLGVEPQGEFDEQNVANSITSKLRSTFEKRKVANISSKTTSNLKVQKEWNAGKIDLLVAPQSSLPSLNLDRADHVIYVSPPNSVAALYQATHGATASVKACSILFNNVPHLTQAKTKRSLEREHANAAHGFRFKGQDKEYWILKEILHQVSFPSMLTEENELTQLIHKKTGIEIRMNLVAQRLYITEKDTKKTFGYLDLSKENLTAVPLIKEKEQAQVAEIFLYTKNFIQDKRGVNHTPLLIEKYFRPAHVPGIIPRINDLKIGERGTLELAFVNNTVHKIQDIISNLFEGESVIYNIEIVLQNKSTMKISLEEEIFQKSIWAACQDSFTPAFFIKKVNEYYKQFLNQRDKAKKVFYKDYIVEIQLPADLNARSRIEGLLLQMRTKNDTFKAMHTLYNLAIIDDYTIDFKQKRGAIFFERKTDKTYLKALEDQLKLHLSDNEVRAAIESINRNPTVGGLTGFEPDLSSILEQVLQIWLAFVYQNIEPKRLLEVNKILASCNREGGPINTLMALHFESRYSHPRHLPNLPEDLDYLGFRNLNTVWKYMKLVGEERQDFSFVSNLFQLELCVNQLIKTYPNQATLLLLKAFTYIYKYTNTNSEQKLEILNKIKLKEGARALIDGFIDLKTQRQLDSKEFNQHINTFCQLLIGYRKELKEFLPQVTDWLQIEAHNRWLKTFNNVLVDSR